MACHYRMQNPGGLSLRKISIQDDVDKEAEAFQSPGGSHNEGMLAAKNTPGSTKCCLSPPEGLTLKERNISSYNKGLTRRLSPPEGLTLKER